LGRVRSGREEILHRGHGDHRGHREERTRWRRWSGDDCKRGNREKSGHGTSRLGINRASGVNMLRQYKEQQERKERGTG